MNLVSKKVIQISCGGVHNIAIVESPPYLLAKDLFQAYLRQDYVDMCFILNNNEKIFAHKVVIASRSPYLKEKIIEKIQQ